MSQIQGKWIEPGTIVPSLLDSTATYTMGSVNVSGDATIGGGLRVDGTISATAIKTDIVMYNSLQIRDTEDEIGLYVQQQEFTSTQPVVYVDNTGTGATMVLMSGPGNNVLGVGVVPTVPLDVNGVARFRSDATVNGGFRVDGTMSAGVISSEVMVYDQLQVLQGDNQEALIVTQTDGSATAIVTRIVNGGTGPALTIEGATPTVAIGASLVTAGQTLDVNGKVRIADTLTCVKDATVSGGISTNQETVGTLTVTSDAGVGTDLQVGIDLRVTRDATVGSQLRVAGSANVLGPSLNAAQDATVGNVLTVGTKALSVDGTFSNNLQVTNYLGVGQTNPQAKVQVTTGTGYGGAIGPHADTQVLIDRNGNAGLQILTPAANSGVIYFGDLVGNQQGRIIYNNSTDGMYLYSGNSLSITADSSHRVIVGGASVAGAAHADADDLVVGQVSTGSNGITVVSSPGNVGTLAFSESLTLTNQGRIEYDHNTQAMKMYADGTAAVLVEMNDSFPGRPVVGIGLTDPQTYANSNANELVVGSTSGNHGMTIVAGTANTGALMFSDGISATDKIRGRIQYSHSTNSMSFWTDATQRAILTDDTGSDTAMLGVGTATPKGVVHGNVTWNSTTTRAAILGESDGVYNAVEAIVIGGVGAANLFEGRRGTFTDNTRVFTVNQDGTVTARTYATSYPADFAEWCVVKGDLDDYSVGTVVQQSDEPLTVETASDPEAVYGVVTDRATFCGGLTGQNTIGLSTEQVEHEFSAKRIAMVGHVKVRVIEPVTVGQRLTISEIPGVSRVAVTTNEKVFAFAISRQNFTPDEDDEIGLVEVRLL